MLRIGVIGLGYWGPNLVRCFQEIPECRVTYVCDRDTARLSNLCARFPDVVATQVHAEVLRRDRIDAVVIATPTRTHFQLAQQALAQGIHVFVEKPLATSSQECAEL